MTRETEHWLFEIWGRAKMLYKYVFGIGAMTIVQYIRCETYCFLYNLINKGIWMHFTSGTYEIQQKQTNKQTN